MLLAPAAVEGAGTGGPQPMIEIPVRAVVQAKLAQALPVLSH